MIGKLLRAGVLSAFGLFIICIINGCTDYDRVVRVDEPKKINLLTTSPENGGKIPLNGELRLVFDNSPKSVTVDGKPAIIEDNTAIVKIANLPKVTPGAKKTVIITWKNPDNFFAGASAITFTVLKPIADPSQSDDSADDKLPNATTVTISPVAGATISLNQHFTLTFDQSITAATINNSAATGLGRNWTASPVLTKGTATLNIRWTNRDGSTSSKVVGPYIINDLGDVDNPNNNGVQTPPATTVVVNPVPGARISSNQHFTLTFNQSIQTVTINGNAVSGSGHHWTALPVLSKGSVTLSIKWINRDGSAGSKTVGPYIVDDLGGVDTQGDNSPPATEVWIDPAPGSTLLPDQLFTLTFNQEIVEATLNRTPATGSGINWTAQPILPTRSELRQRRDRLVESYNRVPSHMPNQTRRMLQDLAAGRINLTIWWRNKDGSTSSKTVGPFTVTDPDSIPPPAATVTVNPAPGSTVLLKQKFKLTFDQEVVWATVNGKSARGSRLMWTVQPRLVVGIAMLEIEWKNRDGSTGSKVIGPYTVKK